MGGSIAFNEREGESRGDARSAPNRGAVRGLPEPVEAEERLANLISDTILPKLVPAIEILPWRYTYVLAVQVYPSGARPLDAKS
jgi:hypothetical protein